MPHTKPSKEELEANIAKVNAELETPATPPKVETPPAEPVKEPEKQPETPPTEPAKQPETPPATPEPDFKEKFVQSSKEAQVLHAKNKKMNEVLEKASQLEAPTDEELSKEYTEWEVMSDFEKKMATEAFTSKRYRDFIAEGTKEFKDIDAWSDKVDGFIDNPEVLIAHPELEGKTEEFKAFASKPTRRGVDFEDLLKAFLFDVKATKPVNKGSQMEGGSGGPNDKSAVSDKLTVEEGRALRQTDYNKWKEMARAGKIASDF